MNWKNRLLSLLVTILRWFAPKNPQGNRFLVVSTTALGDTLWATPAIRSLKHSFPDSYIILLTSSIFEIPYNSDGETVNSFLRLENRK
jgi:uncharacterized phage-like protein YoqJ